MTLGNGIRAVGRTAMSKDEWLTPPDLIKALGRFDLDPCSPITRPWPTADHHFTVDDDGLTRKWFGRVWANPPYGKAAALWLARMVQHGCGTALIFARTETEMFFQHVWAEASALLFLQGRLTFHHVDGSLPRLGANSGGPSVLIAYGLKDADALADSGLGGAFVPLACTGQIVAVLRPAEADAITWADLIEATVRRAGGKVSLDVAYTLVAKHPKAAANQNWQAKVRQVLQGTRFRRVATANYELALGA